MSKDMRAVRSPSPGRDRIPSKSGFLDKKSRWLGKYRRRWMVLDGTRLLSYKQAMQPGSKPTEVISLAHYRVMRSVSEETDPTKRTFELTNPAEKKSVFSFAASSESEKEAWMSELQYAIGLALGDDYAEVGSIIGEPDVSDEDYMDIVDVDTDDSRSDTSSTMTSIASMAAAIVRSPTSARKSAIGRAVEFDLESSPTPGESPKGRDASGSTTTTAGGGTGSVSSSSTSTRKSKSRRSSNTDEPGSVVTSPAPIGGSKTAGSADVVPEDAEVEVTPPPAKHSSSSRARKSSTQTKEPSSNVSTKKKSRDKASKSLSRSSTSPDDVGGSATTPRGGRKKKKKRGHESSASVIPTKASAITASSERSTPRTKSRDTSAGGSSTSTSGGTWSQPGSTVVSPTKETVTKGTSKKGKTGSSKTRKKGTSKRGHKKGAQTETSLPSAADLGLDSSTGATSTSTGGSGRHTVVGAPPSKASSPEAPPKSTKKKKPRKKQSPSVSSAQIKGAASKQSTKKKKGGTSGKKKATTPSMKSSGKSGEPSRLKLGYVDSEPPSKVRSPSPALTEDAEVEPGAYVRAEGELVSVPDIKKDDEVDEEDDDEGDMVVAPPKRMPRISVNSPVPRQSRDSSPEGPEFSAPAKRARKSMGFRERTPSDSRQPTTDDEDEESEEELKMPPRRMSTSRQSLSSRRRSSGGNTLLDVRKKKVLVATSGRRKSATIERRPRGSSMIVQSISSPYGFDGADASDDNLAQTLAMHGRRKSASALALAGVPADRLFTHVFTSRPLGIEFRGLDETGLIGARAHKVLADVPVPENSIVTSIQGIPVRLFELEAILEMLRGIEGDIRIQFERPVIDMLVSRTPVPRASPSLRARQSDDSLVRARAMKLDDPIKKADSKRIARGASDALRLDSIPRIKRGTTAPPALPSVSEKRKIIRDSGPPPSTPVLEPPQKKQPPMRKALSGGGMTSISKESVSDIEKRILGEDYQKIVQAKRLESDREYTMAHELYDEIAVILKDALTEHSESMSVADQNSIHSQIDSYKNRSMVMRRRGASSTKGGYSKKPPSSSKRGAGKSRRKSDMSGVSTAKGGLKKRVKTRASVADSTLRQAKKAGAGKRPAGSKSVPSTGSSGDAGDEDDADEDDADAKKKKSGLDKQDESFRGRVAENIIDEKPDVSFRDVQGLVNVKLILFESVILPQLRPDIFTALRAPTNGLLLFGPPGNGKTMIAKCVAAECDSTFFSISASAITSKFVGDAERIMRTLFDMAREKAPSIVFIDEIDSLLTKRGGSGEAESSRRIKTEFLIQFDGVHKASDEEKRVLVIGATNLPEQLDDAVLRRFSKRVLVPLPDSDTRLAIIHNMMSKQKCKLTGKQLRQVVTMTEGYSGSDLALLCKDASMGPVRKLGAAIISTKAEDIPPVAFDDFKHSLKNVRPSLASDALQHFLDWNDNFGSQMTGTGFTLPESMQSRPIDQLKKGIDTTQPPDTSSSSSSAMSVAEAECA